MEFFFYGVPVGVKVSLAPITMKNKSTKKNNVNRNRRETIECNMERKGKKKVEANEMNKSRKRRGTREL